MIKVGEYNVLKVVREVEFGVYLDDGGKASCCRSVLCHPALKLDDELEVFIYHDSEQRLIATTLRPAGIVGEIVMLEVVSVTPQGAFMDWGLTTATSSPASTTTSVFAPAGMPTSKTSPPAPSKKHGRRATATGRTSPDSPRGCSASPATLRRTISVRRARICRSKRLTMLPTGTRPKTMVTRRSDLARLAKLSALLSDRQRELIALRYGATLNNRLIAQITGLSESNVGTVAAAGGREAARALGGAQMNDDFLYRIRTEPPAHFATALKDRLDSAPRRRAKAMRLGLGALLFGTAFAMVMPGVRHSILALMSREASAPAVVARDAEAPRTPTTVTPLPEAPSAGESSTEPAHQPKRATSLPTRPGALPRAVTPAIVASDDEALDDEALNELSPVALIARARHLTPDDLFSSVIPATPWPVVAADAKEAVTVIETRRALFRVISYNFERIDPMARGRRELDRDFIALSAYRLLQLSAMIDDAYTVDARRWTDVESANPLVWNQRVLFRKKIEAFSESARALLESTAKAEGPEIWRAAERVRKTCFQCHAEFSYRRDLPPRG